MSDVTFKSIGFTNITRAIPGVVAPQRTIRSAENRHARLEPTKVYETKGKAASYTLPGYEVAEVFVREAAY